MYTQCSNCDTVFKLSAEVLRAAGGQVRCGRCGEVFNALARLSEQASTFETHESSLELEQRADSILETVRPPHTDPEPVEDSDAHAMDVARLQILDFDMSDLTEVAPEPVPPTPPLKVVPVKAPATAAPPQAAPRTAEPKQAGDEASGENSLEFTLPPGELDRIFVEAKSGVRPPFPLGTPQSPPLPVAPAPQTPRASPKPPSAKAAPEPLAANPGVPPPVAGTQNDEEDGGPLPDIEVVKDNRVSGQPAGGGFISDAARRQMLDSVDPAEFDLGSNKPALLGGSFALWLTLAILAALSLTAQLVHRNREWLASHGPAAPLVRALYSTMGAPVAAPANLAAYQLRQWGVTGDPSAGSTLKVRASIMNTSAQLVAFPLLRVTLANRYGASLGRRDFEPNEYLGKPTARLLAPGERVDATLSIIDPGKDAEGFEIDVCLRGSDQRIVCANDVAPPQPKS